MPIEMRSMNTNIDSPEEGTYMGRIVGMIDLDLQPGYEFKGELVPAANKLLMVYELPSSRTKDDKPHWVSEELKISDHERSKMYERVKTLDPRGEVTNKGKNLERLVNQPCMVSISLSDKGWANISNVSNVPVGMPVPEVENPLFVFEFNNPDMEVYKRLPKYFRNKLKAAVNYEGSKLHQLVVEGGYDAEDETTPDDKGY